MNHFYNTTQETGITRLRYESTAERQEDTILRFFKAHPGELFTPSEINSRVLPRAEITSVRRAMTNLTTWGDLVMTAVKRQSPRGRPEHCWAYPKQDGKRVSGSDLLL